MARHSFSEFRLDKSHFCTFLRDSTCCDSPSFSSLKDLVSRTLSAYPLHFLFPKISLVCEFLFFANFYLLSGSLANSHSVINSRLIERFAHFRVAVVGALVAWTVNNTLTVFSVQFIWNLRCVGLKKKKKLHSSFSRGKRN